MGSCAEQLRAIPLCKALFCEVNPIPVKKALNLMGKEAGTILKHQIETRDPQVTHRVMSPLLEVRKSTRAIVL